MPYYFKINNYKGRKKRTYTKWKRLEKASLIENKNNLNIHLKQIITAIFLIIALI
jgi:hypothetical protein